MAKRAHAPVDESFQLWLGEVDDLLLHHAGITHRDLADQSWRDWHGDGLEPAEVIELLTDLREGWL